MEQKAIDRLLEELRSTDLFKEYEQAYAEVTHLPLVLRSSVVDQHIDFDHTKENDFCHFMRQHNESCKTCLHVGEKDKESGETLHHSCFAGVHVSAVPIKVHQEVIGYLQTGEVLLEKPTQTKLDDATKTLLNWGINLSGDDLKNLLESGPLLSPKQYEAIVKMLEIFGRHISELAARLSVTPELNEPDGIRKSRDFILKNLDEKLTLDQVASVANMSASHFCRVFKKATDMNFSEYVARVRVERAKEMLLESNYTMTHVAYDCGFNSVTDFNRTFKKITGETPSGFRKQ
jgi:AraC-like DNA-binding protein/ligand-binding sensor protein